MEWYEIVGIVYAVCWILLLTWSFFNRDELTVGQLALGFFFAPIIFIGCYADWDAKVIVWRRKKP